MGQSAEELRRGIAETRDDLGTTVDAISDHVSPARVIERRKEKLASRWHSTKESVMGNASDLHASIGSANDSASEAVGNIPHQVAAQAKGQPLVAGAVAFGLGFLAAAAFPGTPAEGQLAQRVQDMAQPAVDQLKESGQEAVSALKEPALEGAQHLKDAVAESADQVRHAADEAVGHAKDTASQGGQQVGDQVKQSAQEIRPTK